MNIRTDFEAVLGRALEEDIGRENSITPIFDDFPDLGRMDGISLL